MNDRRTFLRLLRLAWPFRWWMLLSVLLGVLTVGAGISLMALSAWIIATAALHPSIAELNIAIVGVRFFGIARGVLRYLERLVAHDTTFRLLARLRTWFYRRLEPLAPARLMEQRSGDLLARIVGDIDTLENVFLRVIAPPLVALLVAGGMFAFMALHDLRLALSLTAFLALAGAGVPLLVRRLSRDVGQQTVQTRADLTVQLIDGVQGLADLVAYNAQDRHAARIEALNRRYRDQQAAMARVAGLQSALVALLTGLAVIVTLVIAIPLVTGGTYSGVILAVLALATLAAFEAVGPLPAAFQHLDASLAAARRLFAIADDSAGQRATHTQAHAPPAPLRDPVHALPPPALHITKLRFRYTPDDPPALDGVSLDLPPGATVAVVGASGAGKSTLVNLLLRFWDDYSGAITVANRDHRYDLRALPEDEVRVLFSVVSQRTYLFNGTIRDNLQLADPHASEADLVRACTAAQIHAFIAGLPQGYDTAIGEQGFTLSGGERQRLAIARAILKDAPILLLDEATANLDSITERALLETIFTALAGRSILMITHRLVELERADTIVVLERGRVVERGTHADLLRAGGAYRRLWAQQHDRLALDVPAPGAPER